MAGAQSQRAGGKGSIRLSCGCARAAGAPLDRRSAVPALLPPPSHCCPPCLCCSLPAAHAHAVGAEAGTAVGGAPACDAVVAGQPGEGGWEGAGDEGRADWRAGHGQPSMPYILWQGTWAFDPPRGRPALPCLQEPILALRRQLASLSGAAAEAGECWLQLAQLCRGTGHYEAATTAVLEAVASRVPWAPLEHVQLLWDKGQPYRAVSEAQLLAQQAQGHALAAPFAKEADHSRFHAQVGQGWARGVWVCGRGLWQRARACWAPTCPPRAAAAAPACPRWRCSWRSGWRRRGRRPKMRSRVRLAGGGCWCLSTAPACSRRGRCRIAASAAPRPLTLCPSRPSPCPSLPPSPV